jgi:hypothetical protein
MTLATAPMFSASCGAFRITHGGRGGVVISSAIAGFARARDRL